VRVRKKIRAIAEDDIRMQIAKCNYMSMQRNKILTLFALINILGAIQSFISGGAGTGEGSVDRAGVADRALVTRI